MSLSNKFERNLKKHNKEVYQLQQREKKAARAATRIAVKEAIKEEVAHIAPIAIKDSTDINLDNVVKVGESDTSGMHVTPDQYAEKNGQMAKRCVGILRAQGDTIPEIAVKLDISAQDVDVIMSATDFTETMSAVQTVLKIPASQRLEMGNNQALEVVYQIMNDKNVKHDVKLRAAFDWLDRTFGKATQRTEALVYNVNDNINEKEIHNRIKTSEENIKRMENQRKLLKTSRKK